MSFDRHSTYRRVFVFELLMLAIGYLGDPWISYSSSIRQAGFSRLKGGRVIFFTTDDDKDADTRLSVYVSRGNTQFAYADNGDYFRDNSQQTVGLKLNEYRPTFNEILNGGVLRLLVFPNGHDTWKFNCLIELDFDDGQRYSRHFDGNFLSEQYRERVFPLN